MTINELVAAVDNALYGCGAAPTPILTPIVVSGGDIAAVLKNAPAGSVVPVSAGTYPALVLEAGDLVAMVTDGVTEAASVADQEFGDLGVMEVLRKSRAAGAEKALGALVDAVHAWAGPVGCADDLTALVLRAV